MVFEKEASAVRYAKRLERVRRALDWRYLAPTSFALLAAMAAWGILAPPSLLAALVFALASMFLSRELDNEWNEYALKRHLFEQHGIETPFDGDWLRDKLRGIFHRR